MIKFQPRQSQKHELYYDQVISLYRDEHLGPRRISRIIPLACTTISRWIRNFVAENPEMISDRMQHSRESKERKASIESVDPAKAQEVKELQLEVARLTRELRKASMRADAYEELINVAEKKFNIAIRKKAGTKQ